jgi:hypothetical protein
MGQCPIPGTANQGKEVSLTHKPSNHDRLSELGILAAAVFCAACWLGIASLFIQVEWWFWLPVLGGMFYLVMSHALERFRE